MAYIVLPTLAAEPVLVSRTSAPAWAAGRPARARERAADRREAMRGRRAMHGGRIGCSRRLLSTCGALRASQLQQSACMLDAPSAGLRRHRADHRRRRQQRRPGTKRAGLYPSSFGSRGSCTRCARWKRPSCSSPTATAAATTPDKACGSRSTDLWVLCRWRVAHDPVLNFRSRPRRGAGRGALARADHRAARLNDTLRRGAVFVALVFLFSSA